MENSPKPQQQPKAQRKGGRKRLPEKKKRSESIPEIRVTKFERERLDKKAAQAGVSITEYCRRQLLGTAPLYWVNPLELMAAFREVSKEMHPVGSNINQMTKHANTAAANCAINQDQLTEYMALVSVFIKQQAMIAQGIQKFISGRK